MPRKAEAAIWASEFTAGKLPSVCVKSGRSADSTLRFGFSQPASTGALLASAAMSIVVPTFPGGRSVRGPLPLIRPWRQTFLLLRVAIMASIAIAVLLLFTTGLTPSELKAGWVGSAFACLAASFVIALVYGGLKPKGEVFKARNGELWVRLREVHPNFARSVARLDP